MNGEEFVANDFDEFANSPAMWLMSANELSTAASLLVKSMRENDFFKVQFKIQGPYYMLVGYALECLFDFAIIKIDHIRAIC
jgi:hypothetical protein